VLYIVGLVAACGSSASTTGGSTSASASSSATSPSSTESGSLPQPCTFLTQTTAAEISGDAAIMNQSTNFTETVSGYVACIFADTKNEANSVEVQIKRASGGVTPSMLQAAVEFFSLGEPVQPFRPFSVVGIGDNAFGESTLGVAFIVFSKGGVLAYVGAGSASLSVSSLQASVENLTEQVAAGL
jgi:Protein of unknown function (DUF3558)